MDGSGAKYGTKDIIPILQIKIFKKSQIKMFYKTDPTKSEIPIKNTFSKYTKTQRWNLKKPPEMPKI